MPLRDHFRPPLEEQRGWEGMHHEWASTIVRQLNAQLPDRYYAEPRAHLGTLLEVDVATFEPEDEAAAASDSGNGIATAVWAPPRATRALAVGFPAQDVFEVRVFDEQRTRHLVAAIELVSPANKDRPDTRHAFAIKCAAYLQQQVAVVIVDVVTSRRANLYGELLSVLELPKGNLLDEDTPTYAVACRTTKDSENWRLETWEEILTVGASLPTLPLWLASDLAVPLELEASYAETCRVLRIR